MSNFIKIGIRGEFQGEAFKQGEAALKAITGEADKFVDALRAGVGIDLGGKLVNSLAALPGIFQNAIQQGVAFNAKLSDAEIAIANVVGQFAGLNKEAAKGVAAKAMQQIIELEPKTAATLDGLVQGFMATLASSQSAGLSVEQNIDLVGKFANALANANIPAEQLSQELRAIFTGNITPDAALATTLSIKPADIARAKEAGTLYQFLSEKVGQLGEAGDTFAVRWSSLQSAIDKSLATLSKPVFDALKEALTGLGEELSNPQTVAALRQLGIEIGNAAKTGLELVQVALKYAPALSAAAHVAGVFGAALAAMGIAKIITGLGLKTAAWLTTAKAIDAATAALMRNAAAQGGGAGATAARAAMTGGAYRATGAAAAGAAATGAAVVIGVVGLAAAGVAIGSWINGVIEDSRAKAAAARANNFGGKDANAAITELQNRALDANSETAPKVSRDIQKEILATTFQMEEGDSRLAKIAQERLRWLEQIQASLAGSVEMNDSHLAGETRLTREAEAQARAKQEAALAAASAGAWAAAGDEMGGIWEKDAMASDDRPTRMKAISDAMFRERDKYRAAGGQASNEAGGQEMLAGAAGGVSAAHALQLATIAERMLGLEKQMNAESAKGSEEQVAKNKAVREESDRREETLKTVQEEFAILTARVHGEDDMADELERQRTTRQQIESLVRGGMLREEATNEAIKTAELRKQLALKEQMEKKALAQAGLDVESAGPGKRQQRLAREAEFKLQRRDELQEAGFEGAELDQAVDQSLTAFRRKGLRADGRIGGSAARSSRDTLGGGRSNLDGFGGGLGAPATPGLDALAALQQPLGELLGPTSPANAPAPEAEGGTDLGKAAAAVERGGKDLSSAAKKLETAGENLSEKAGTELTEAAAKIDNATSTIVSKLGEFSDRLDTMQTQIDAIRTSS